MNQIEAATANRIYVGNMNQNFGPSIASKLVKVMSDVEKIEKTGTNQNQHYSYAEESQVSKHIRKSLIKHNIAFFPNVYETNNDIVGQSKAGNPRVLTTLVMTGTFVCGDTGEHITASVVATGIDPGDKSSYKANTGAVKYILMKTFLLETTDDPEKDSDIDKEESAANDQTKDDPKYGQYYTISMTSTFKDGYCNICHEKHCEKGSNVIKLKGGKADGKWASYECLVKAIDKKAADKTDPNTQENEEERMKREYDDKIAAEAQDSNQ